MQHSHQIGHRLREMARFELLSVAILICACAGSAIAQADAPIPTPSSTPVLQKRPTTVTNAETTVTAEPHETISLTVPKGTPVQVALDKEVRVRKVGQLIQGHVVEPIFAFDKLEIPVGTLVNGQITKIQSVSNGKRTLAALDADFTPTRKIQIEFNEFVLPDGKHISVHTAVIPGSGHEISFVAQPEDDRKKSAKDVASEKAKEARAQAKNEWDAAMQQVKEPGKVHRAERAALAQLPAHPQYIDAGTVYFAELQDSLDFGSEPLTAELATSLTAPPPDGSFVHARLVTPLDSATAHRGDEVQAILSRPLFDGDRLILPQGSLLKGSIVQAESARRLSHNGQLRFVFHDLVFPNGLDQKVDAVLQGVQAAKSDNVKLDAEGGARATSSRARYLSTGVSVGLAALSFAGDGDSDPGNREAGGAGGYKLIGLAIGLTVRSQPLGMAMGSLGASRSIYVHFIARGHEVVFPRNTALEIAIGTRQPTPESVPANPRGQ